MISCFKYGDCIIKMFKLIGFVSLVSLSFLFADATQLQSKLKKVGGTTAGTCHEDGAGNCVPCSLKCSHAKDDNWSAIEAYGTHWESQLQDIINPYITREAQLNATITQLQQTIAS